MILIVDDNPQNIFSLKTLLALHQFEVDTASSGEEALKKILKQTYSLVILDVQMPEMDGFEVAEAISGYSKSKDIPIIFLSAVNIHKKFITKGYASGGIDYVTKPFDPDILLLKIKTFYRLSEQTRQLNAMEKSLREEIDLRKKAENVLESRVRERTKELMKSNQQLEESNRELQQFAFIASHDLQEPLRKIQIFSNLVTEKYFMETEKMKSYLGKISESATRMRNLITDLLAYSKIYVDDAFVAVDLDAILKEILADLELQIKINKCIIEVSGLPQIEAIPYQIRQALQNLVSNAIKFSRAGVPCRITISGERINEKSFTSVTSIQGPYCRLSITDNGIGFNNEFREKIFEIFQRLNGRNVYEGTGIGLSIVKKVIERHDGLITASGKENEGASFTMILPVKHKPRLQ